MATYTIRKPLYVDGPRRGDLIVIGYGGDNPDVVLDKLLASHATIPAGLTADEREQVERGWPRGRINGPDKWVVGTVARAGSGRVLAVTTIDGERRDMRGVHHYRYAHREQIPDPDVALAFAAAAPSYEAAEDVLLQHAVGDPRPDPGCPRPFEMVQIER